MFVSTCLRINSKIASLETQKHRNNGLFVPFSADHEQHGCNLSAVTE